MLTTLFLFLASPQPCTDVKQQCRACTQTAGKRNCSNIGIACQPSRRICRPGDTPTPKVRPADKPRAR